MKAQLNGELRDKIDEDEGIDLQEASPAKDDASEDEEVKVKGDEVDDQVDDNDDDDGEGGEEYIVESITDHKMTKKGPIYFIKWQGWPEDDNTWEPEENLLPYAHASLSDVIRITDNL